MQKQWATLCKDIPSYTCLPGASLTISSSTTLISHRRTARCSKLAPDFLGVQWTLGFPNNVTSLCFVHLCPQLHIVVSLFDILLSGWKPSIGGDLCLPSHHLPPSPTSFMKFSRRKGWWITVLRRLPIGCWSPQPGQQQKQWKCQGSFADHLHQLHSQFPPNPACWEVGMRSPSLSYNLRKLKHEITNLWMTKVTMNRWAFHRLSIHCNICWGAGVLTLRYVLPPKEDDLLLCRNVKPVSTKNSRISNSSKTFSVNQKLSNRLCFHSFLTRNLGTSLWHLVTLEGWGPFYGQIAIAALPVMLRPLLCSSWHSLASSLSNFAWRLLLRSACRIPFVKNPCANRSSCDSHTQDAIQTWQIVDSSFPQKISNVQECIEEQSLNNVSPNFSPLQICLRQTSLYRSLDFVNNPSNI